VRKRKTDTTRFFVTILLVSLELRLHTGEEKIADETNSSQATVRICFSHCVVNNFDVFHHDTFHVQILQNVKKEVFIGYSCACPDAPSPPPYNPPTGQRDQTGSCDPQWALQFGS
jgi:hypothetical protein